MSWKTLTFVGLLSCALVGCARLGLDGEGRFPITDEDGSEEEDPVVGGPCEYEEVAGTCRAEGDDADEPYYSFSPDDASASIPDWADLGRVWLDDAPVGAESFSCQCDFILSGTCTPVICSAGSV